MKFVVLILSLIRHSVSVVIFCIAMQSCSPQVAPLNLSINTALSTSVNLPRLQVDITYVPGNGNVITVSAGEDFQAALDRANLGDTIELQAGAVFQGPFTLPNKEGVGWVEIRTSELADLPTPGTRVAPSDSDLMATLVANSRSVISTQEGAHHYRFVGIEIRPGLRIDGRGIALVNLITLADNNRTIEEMPHHFIFDRVYVHGDPIEGSRRGIAMNSSHTAIIDSYFSNFKVDGQDAQAIAGWGGSGPYKIANNYLEASGENIMFGGADPSIEDMVPADIEVIGNRFAKPLSWKVDDPSYEGTPWSVKNLFELKNAKRVLIDGNLFEYNWPHAQNGFAILFTVRNEDGRAPWSVIEDVTFSNNLLRHVGSGVNIMGHDNRFPSAQTKRILIKNNLFEDVGGEWGNGRLFQLLDGADDVSIVNNTAFNTENIVMAEGRSHQRFIYDSNIAIHNDYGIIGTSFGMGMPTINRYFPGSHISNNVMIGGSARYYPGANFFPSSIKGLDFVDPSTGDFRLNPESRYWSENSEASVGADLDTLCLALSEVDRAEFCRPQ